MIAKPSDFHRCTAGPFASTRPNSDGRKPGLVTFVGKQVAEGRMTVVLVAGVDSATQSCKVLLCDADDGTVVASGSAPHPDGTECDPAAWWDALQAAGDGLLQRAAAVGVAGQQHGMIMLDGDGDVIRP